jgi:hypothetical protein
MTITRARLIVRNRLAYAPQKVREAAVWLLGSLGATAEDVQYASTAITIGTRDRPSGAIIPQH